MNTRAAERCSLTPQNAAAFAAWARVYDTQANPLLTLEERFLKCLLPDIDGKDILDIGCGTGRWLERFTQFGSPRSLFGIDSSDEMLAAVRRKSIAGTSLLRAELPLLPLSSDSFDLALASFVLSYVLDIDTCARELGRVLHNDADLFITDMHPVTAAELGWQRSFSSPQGTLHLHNEPHPIESIVRSMSQHDLHLVGSYQPSFGEDERPIFLSNGKEVSYQAASDKPAIYLLHFKRRSATVVSPDIFLGGASCVLGGGEIIPANLTVQDGRIASITSLENSDATHHVDLSGYTLYPGLINAHDHLEFALYPRLGEPPYGNATDWAHDIQSHFRDVINAHQQVPKAVRLWWGALRNLLCGVTTVCHHNPFHQVFEEPNFPIRVITEFGWGHSLAFAEDLANAYSETPSSYPFVLHACEGIDAMACSEFAQLEKMKLINDRTVIVHGLAMTRSEVDILNRCGGSLISCPSSNQFLFLGTPSSDHLDLIRRLAIGSDSPLTAIGDLLDEVGFCNQQLLLSAEKLFDCVTREPARILHLRYGSGHLLPGFPADIFAVRDSTLPPAEHLATLSWRDVELVIVNGSIRLASIDMLERLPSQLSRPLSCLLIDGVPRWIDAPIKTLFQSTAEILGTANISLNGRKLSVMEE